MYTPADVRDDTGPYLIANSQRQLAAALGVGLASVQHRLRRGGLVRTRNGGFDVRATVRSWRFYARPPRGNRFRAPGLLNPTIALNGGHWAALRQRALRAGCYYAPD